MWVGFFCGRESVFLRYVLVSRWFGKVEFDSIGWSVRGWGGYDFVFVEVVCLEGGGFGGKFLICRLS